MTLLSLACWVFIPTVSKPSYSPKQLEESRLNLAERLVAISSSTGFARGQAIAEITANKTMLILQQKEEFYRQFKGDTLGAWHRLARQLEPAIKAHAPVAAAELAGSISVGARINGTSIWSLLAVEYEMLMSLGAEADKCTGVATDRSRSNDGGSAVVLGQNNDEEPSQWLDGALDMVLQLTDSSARTPAVLAYTHPGYPPYMGINQHGVTVLWQYIDDGSRNLEGGVPTNILIRELLAQRSVGDALLLLESVPVAVPNLVPWRLASRCAFGCQTCTWVPAGEILHLARRSECRQRCDRIHQRKRC